MDLYRIEKNIHEDKYKTVEVFENDVKLMCANAQEYNMEGSMIYQDSEVLSLVFRECKRQLSNGEKDVFVEPGSFTMGPPTYVPPPDEDGDDEEGTSEDDDSAWNLELIFSQVVSMLFFSDTRPPFLFYFVGEQSEKWFLDMKVFPWWKRNFYGRNVGRCCFKKFVVLS